MLKFGNTYLNYGGTYLSGWEACDPYNPLDLPTNTIRCKFTNGYTPDMGETQTLVDSTNNVWDIYKASNNWTSLFSSNTNLLEVLGANSSNVINMYKMLFTISIKFKYKRM